jgi:hypothetical protein
MPNIIESAAEFAAPVLNLPVVRRIRRNHGLEHATIHMLSRRVRGLKVAGYSTHEGFILVGNPNTNEVAAAANDALTRMKRGESGLAIHPNCGTNLFTTTVLTTLAAAAGTASKRRGTDRLSLTFVLVMLALVIGQPLGLLLQKHFTTNGVPGDLEIEHISRHEITLPFSGSKLTIHNITTRNG